MGPGEISLPSFLTTHSRKDNWSLLQESRSAGAVFHQLQQMGEQTQLCMDKRVELAVVEFVWMSHKNLLSPLLTTALDELELTPVVRMLQNWPTNSATTQAQIQG